MLGSAAVALCCWELLYVALQSDILSALVLPNKGPAADRRGRTAEIWRIKLVNVAHAAIVAPLAWLVLAINGRVVCLKPF